MNHSAGAIPDWNHSGLLPANDPAASTSHDRSPYTASLLDLAVRFGHTSARRRLLTGLLDYRAELHKAGLMCGFQWIDGSFIENIEESEQRRPKDVDLVTFFHIPDKHTSESLRQDFPELFDNSKVMANYDIDAYFVQLNQVTPEETVRESTYWYSLWSHTRDGEWKGYVEVDLSGDDDESIRVEIERIDEEGGQP